MEVHRHCCGVLGIGHGIGRPVEDVGQTILCGTSPLKSSDDGACERVLGSPDWFKNRLRIDLVADDGHLAIHATVDIGVGI